MEQPRTITVRISEDAAIVLALAEAAAPFAMSVQEEVERWLRVMRAHGRAGALLQGLGVGESCLEAWKGSESPRPRWLPRADQVVAAVRTRACAVASERSASVVATTDVLLAVSHVYAEAFDQALIACGTSHRELAERLERTGLTVRPAA